MKKTLLTLLLFIPFLALAQNKVEEITLSNGRTAVLYDNGLWVYKDNPSPIRSTTPQTLNSNSKPQPSSSQSPNSSAPCGARTKTTGAPCKRMVKGGGYCYQHS